MVLKRLSDICHLEPNENEEEAGKSGILKTIESGNRSVLWQSVGI